MVKYSNRLKSRTASNDGFFGTAAGYFAALEIGRGVQAGGDIGVVLSIQFNRGAGNPDQALQVTGNYLLFQGVGGEG